MNVLILVVVDDGLVLVSLLLMSNYCNGLNPCCSGRWSRTTDSTTITLVAPKS